MPEPAVAPLVSTAWLAERLGEPRVRVVDASWHMPASGRDAEAEFRSSHIPGAVFFDLDANSAQDTSLPHMLPAADGFGRSMSALGLSNGDMIVVYDSSGVNLSAPRAWWMFRAMGHEAVAVLDGGFGKWVSEGRPVEQGNAAPEPGKFVAQLDAGLVASMAQVNAIGSSGEAQIVDARSPGRFDGTEPEPRPGLRSGHIPGSRNVHFRSLVREDGTLKPPRELRQLFEAAGVDITRPVVASCGSGVTACTIVHALEVLGQSGARVYDGSWSEYGSADGSTDEVDEEG
ncbi:MAG TPA: 3-mercaptopyruvate sulfurtransferase [Gemmatimonadales bacterium]|nr:3-mercaptopyruvate sulfurtransferase [Gemmatimonadales bacterium]